MLYAVLDTGLLRSIVGEAGLVSALESCTRTLLDAGVGKIQLRAKDEPPQRVLDYASTVSTAAGPQNACHSEERSDEESALRRAPTLILNDRADLALLAKFDGCHLGQDDLSITSARRILPTPHMLGVSTHNTAQLEAANATDADYLAIGPIFATSTKQHPDPVVGVVELARLRKLTRKPVTAIGGITRNNARAVLDAGADSVAIIRDLVTGAGCATDLPAVFARNVADILHAIR